MQSDSPLLGGGKCLNLKILSLFCIFFTALNAVELETLCLNQWDCSITTPNALITNTQNITHNTINFNANVNDFINYGELRFQSTTTSSQINATMNNLINYGNISNYYGWTTIHTLSVGANGAIDNIFNYGTLLYRNTLDFNNQNSTTYIYNAGVMGGIQSQPTNTIIINNLGTTYVGHSYAFINVGNLVLENYALTINLNASIFNTGEWVQDEKAQNSHLILNNVENVRFKDSDSKIIIDIGNDFELGKEYSIGKLIIDESRNDNANGKIAVDFSRLTTRSDLYEITKGSNNTFRISINAKNSTISSLNKANTKTMQSLMFASNAMIFGGGVGKIGAGKINATKVDFAKQYLANKAIKNNDRFFYKNDLPLLAESSYRLDAIRGDEMPNPKIDESLNTKDDSPKKGKYRFMLTPFVNHNIFFESGAHNLSSIDAGFVTLFSGKINENNELGTHFTFSYSNLKDSNDKAFNVKSANLNLGLNYKVDFIYDTYLKARIDAFVFMNKIKSLTIINTLKPNNIGFGASAYGGKDFHLGEIGSFGVEVGLDYKMLYQKSITISNASNTIYEIYDRAFYHLLYLDLGLAYSKYFSTNIGLWGLNAKVGYRDNLTNNALTKSKVFLSRGGSVNMTMDNDNALGYYTVGGSYLLEKKDFDMEFELNYIGGVGDRSVSNGGGFKWRVLW